MPKMHQTFRRTSDSQVLHATAAIDRVTPQVTEALEEVLGEDGWDVPAACVASIQQALGRVLESRLETLERDVDARRRVAQEGKRWRKERDEAAEEVYNLLVRLRHIVRGMGGAEAERALFGTGKTPREPKKVALTAWELCRWLRSEDTREALGESFGGQATLDGWLETMEEPLARLFRLLDRVALLEQDEATAVRDVRRAREGMKRAKKNALKILEGFFGLAELDDLEDTLRWREPAARGAEESGSAEAAAAGEEIRVDVNQPPAVAEPTEVSQREPQPSAAGAGESHAPRGEPRLVTSDEPDVGTAATGVWELESTSRVGSEEAPFLEVTASVDSPQTPELPAPTHPVRKVLRWLSAVPHRVETPANGASPAVSREEAA